MSLHKLNTFHWHFTDDHGWRFESKKYPVIEMPGYSREVIASYTEFSCAIKPPKPVPYTWRIFKSNLCLGNSATIQFSKDILEEVLEKFNSEFIQIGSEQVRPSYWLKCPKCQKVIVCHETHKIILTPNMISRASAFFP